MIGNVLPETLRELRNEHNYSQSYVAQKLNISRQTYSHYETGRINPPTESLRALAELYHISMDTLVPTNYVRNETNHFIDNLILSGTVWTKGYAEFVRQNKSRLHALSNSEKRLLYFYGMLDDRDQKDIISFMEIKCANRKNEKS